jgi:hypothetical protein
MFETQVSYIWNEERCVCVCVTMEAFVVYVIVYTRYFVFR